MQVLRGNSGIDKLAAAGGGMHELRGNSGTDKLTAAASGGVQVLRGNSGTDELWQQHRMTACEYRAEIPELTNWQQQVEACKYCAEIPEPIGPTTPMGLMLGMCRATHHFDTGP